MSAVALDERLQRERNKMLRDIYGTSDPAEVKRIRELQTAQLTEYKTLKSAAEEQERANMTEQQRLTADLESWKQRAETAEAEVENMKTSVVVSQQTQELQGVAGKYIKGKLVRYALLDFQEHVKALSPEEVQRQTPRSIERWFKKYAEENEDFALPAGTPPEVQPVAAPATPPPAPAAKPPVRRIGLTSSNVPRGGPPKAPPTPPKKDEVAGKTFRPGQPNSMNKQELNGELRKRGIRPW